VSQRNEVGAGRSRKDPRQSRGQAGEALARGYLEQAGYTIIETNYRSRYGEIDIIAFQDRILAFIEVKARLGNRFGQPFEAVGPRKQNQIRRMASMWLATRQGDPVLQECEFRFDVISVNLSELDIPAEQELRSAAKSEMKSAPGITHMMDAFR